MVETVSRGAETAPNQQTAKVALASLVGTTLEWYDYISGAAAALAWPTVFFPAQNPFTAFLASFVLFGLGFVGGPIGALLFGHFGDRIGRLQVLAVSASVAALSRKTGWGARALKSGPRTASFQEGSYGGSG